MIASNALRVGKLLSAKRLAGEEDVWRYMPDTQWFKKIRPAFPSLSVASDVGGVSTVCMPPPASTVPRVPSIGYRGKLLLCPLWFQHVVWCHCAAGGGTVRCNHAGSAGRG